MHSWFQISRNSLICSHLTYDIIESQTRKSKLLKDSVQTKALEPAKKREILRWQITGLQNQIMYYPSCNLVASKTLKSLKFSVIHCGCVFRKCVLSEGLAK